MSADHPKAQQLLVVSLYAAMAAEQQLQVFQPAPPGTRKVLAATCLLILAVTSTRTSGTSPGSDRKIIIGSIQQSTSGTLVCRLA